jgi:hypothetical protein
MSMPKFISLSEFDCPIAVIKVNRLYRPNITDEELSDITRGYWRTSRIKAQKCDIVLSVYRGKVIEVYSVDEWVNGEDLKLSTRINTYRAGSYGFNGHVALKVVRDKFIGRYVNNLYRRGNQNPVMAFNVF